MSDMSEKKGGYVLISPCRDEAQYMERTLDSVIRQTVLPALWLVVDDGSTDATPQILKRYADHYSFIKVIRREDRGARKVGPGVIEAFYEGLNTLNIDDYEFICKLDMDLELPACYFQTLMQRMDKNPRIGACSGKPYYPHPATEVPVSEKCGDEAAVGMTKFYRVTCFKQIGGFVREVFWDAIDGHRSRMLGWIAVSWDDPEIRFMHLRPMGSSHKGILIGRMRHGFGCYFMGSSFFYVLAASAYSMLRRPFIVGGIAIWLGYLKSLFAAPTRYEDQEFRRFLRKYQWRCLLFGKTRATEQLNKQGETIWNPEAKGIGLNG